MRVIERYRRQSAGQMDVSVMIDDSGAYMKPLTYVQRVALRPETELIEYVCENAKEIGKRGVITARVKAGAVEETEALHASLEHTRDRLQVVFELDGLTIDGRPVDPVVVGIHETSVGNHHGGLIERPVAFGGDFRGAVGGAQHEGRDRPLLNARARPSPLATAPSAAPRAQIRVARRRLETEPS